MVYEIEPKGLSKNKPATLSIFANSQDLSKQLSSHFMFFRKEN